MNVSPVYSEQPLKLVPHCSPSEQFMFVSNWDLNGRDHKWDSLEIKSKKETALRQVYETRSQDRKEELRFSKPENMVRALGQNIWKPTGSWARMIAGRPQTTDSNERLLLGIIFCVWLVYAPRFPGKEKDPLVWGKGQQVEHHLSPTNTQRETCLKLFLLISVLDLALFYRRFEAAEITTPQYLIEALCRHWRGWLSHVDFLETQYAKGYGSSVPGTEYTFAQNTNVSWAAGSCL